MSKHTPGPWHIAPALDGHLRPTRITAHGKTVARTDAQFGRPHHHAQDEANANLIAAAPDLCAVVRDLISILASPVADLHCVNQLEADAKPAIAKAEGGQDAE